MLFSNSCILSPPNFSSNASQITRHDMLSAIIDAAGTEQESVRSLCANNFSLEIISTDFKGLTNVGIGFIVPDNIIFCPLLIPPSIPPQLLDNLINLLFS